MFSEQVENDFGTPSKKKRRIQWPSPPRASRRQVQAYRRREKMAAVVFESEVKMKKAEEMGLLCWADSVKTPDDRSVAKQLAQEVVNEKGT